MNDAITLWHRILTAAADAGFAQQRRLAWAAGMDPARLSGLKTNRRMPTPAELERLAAAVHISTEELTAGLQLRSSAKSIQWTDQQEQIVLDEHRALKRARQRLSSDWLTSVGERIDRTGGAVALRLAQLGRISPEEATSWQQSVNAGKRRARQLDRYRSGHYLAAKKVKARDGCCVMCGERRDLEAAHIVPFSKTKSSEPWEMVTLCHRCHRRFEKKMRPVNVRHLRERDRLWWGEVFSRATGVTWELQPAAPRATSPQPP